MNASNLRRIKSDFVKTNDVHQAGLACLSSVIKFYGGNAEMQQLYNNSGAAEDGVNLLGLCKAAQGEGFNANGFKANVDAVKGLEDPVILHVSKGLGNEDFIILYGWHKNKFIIGDPQWGIVEYREDELEAVWKSNTLMLLQPSESFKTKSEKVRFKREWLVKLIENQKRVLSVMSVIGLVLALIIIAFLPFIIKNIGAVLHASNGKKFLFDAALLFIPIVVFIAILHVKNVFVQLGIKSFNLELNTKIVNYFFISFDDSNESSQVNLDSLSKATNQFCVFIFRGAWGIPFYGLLFIISVICISLISILTGMLIVVASVFYFGLIWLNRGNIEKLHTSEYQYLKEKGEVLNKSWDFRKFIKLSNTEKKIASESVETLGLFLDTKAKLKRIKNRIENWFFVWVIVTTLFVVWTNLILGEDELRTFWQPIIGWVIICFFTIYGLKNLVINYFFTKVSFDFFYKRIGNERLSENNQILEGEVNPVLHINKLVVENLSFAFVGQEPLFQGVSFEAKIGEITAVSGASGSGKSVIASVLNRSLLLQSGQVTVNDSSWLNISDFRWRKNTSVVLQPVHLLNCAVLENIGWSEKYLEPKKIVLFCKKMGFHNFIKELPNGYSTKTNNLSAGQKQLIAFVTALYRNPQLLLLDEPFVFMDEEMANFCVELLHKFKNEMVIIIFTGSKQTISKEKRVFVYKMINYNYV